MDGVSDWASPEQVAEAAARVGSRSIAFTYNDRVIFARQPVAQILDAERTFSKATKNTAFKMIIEA